MESKALVKSTNINVACRFFARTPSRILRMVNICEVVDLFLRKPFWFFLSMLSILGSIRFRSRMYVNNSNCDSLPFKIYSDATSYSWLRGRSLDWRLSQPGFDPSYGKPVCLATLMSSDRTKQICLWMTIYTRIIK